MMLRGLERIAAFENFRSLLMTIPIHIAKCILNQIARNEKEQPHLGVRDVLRNIC